MHYNVNGVVIDMNPESRKALELVHRFRGLVRGCYYANNKSNRNIDIRDEYVSVDRTSWLDVSLGRFRQQKIVLPLDILNEYKEHIKAPVKVYRENLDGGKLSTYLTAHTSADHFAHARNYAEIALFTFIKNSTGSGENTDEDL
jgi:hypothetical protein